MVQIGTFVADIKTHFLTEQGSIRLDNESLKITKNSVFKGQWSLEKNGICVAEAKKQTIFGRTFEVQFNDLTLSLEAHTAFTRGFQMTMDHQCVGTIKPIHALTRRAQIDCHEEIPLPIQLFCFWLVMITWRRAQNSNS